MVRKRRYGIALAILLSMSACSTGTEIEPTPFATDDVVGVLSVTGKLVPAVWSAVTATGPGQIVEVLVQEGDIVAEGETLVQLDDSDARVAVRQAESVRLQAQQELARLQAGPSEQTVAVAEAQVEVARTALSQTIEQRDQLWAGQLDAQMAAAEAQIAAAQAEQLVARQQHDETMKCYEVERPDGTMKICPTLGTYEERARAALDAATQALAAAQANKDALETQHWAQVQTAQAGIAMAERQVMLTEAQLAQILAGTTEEELAVAEAALKQAEVAVSAAQAALGHTVVLAPFAGTVGAVEARQGEYAMPGTQLVMLGDLATLRVETTDLDEIDVGSVTVGTRAIVTFDALPDRTFEAEVTHLSPMAGTGGGGVTFKAVLRLDQLDPLLRWGMTAFVDMATQQGGATGD